MFSDLKDLMDCVQRSVGLSGEWIEELVQGVLALRLKMPLIVF